MRTTYVASVLLVLTATLAPTAARADGGVPPNTEPVLIETQFVCSNARSTFLVMYMLERFGVRAAVDAFGDHAERNLCGRILPEDVTGYALVDRVENVLLPARGELGPTTITVSVYLGGRYDYFFIHWGPSMPAPPPEIQQ